MPSIPFVGISNWTIDISKMNRNVYLSRPKPESKVLKETALILLKKEIKSDFQIKTSENELEQLSSILANAYSKFRTTQYEEFPHKNFHSLRDYYWFLKHIGQRITKENIKNNKSKLEIVINSLNKNFSGYMFHTSQKKIVTSVESKQNIFLTYKLFTSI